MGSLFIFTHFFKKKIIQLHFQAQVCATITNKNDNAIYLEVGSNFKLEVRLSSFQGNSFIFSIIQGTYSATLVNTSGNSVLQYGISPLGPMIKEVTPNEFIPTTVTFPLSSITAPPNCQM